MITLRRPISVLASLAVVLAAVAMPTYAAKPPSGGGNLSVTVTGTQPTMYGYNTPAVTTLSVGANEGAGRFNINDLTDLGITNYRLYAGASRFEPVDDDAVFGSPDIPSIKANPSIINWSAWDTQFNRPDGYFWALKPNQANVRASDMLTALHTANVKVVMANRPRDNNNTPAWMPAVPIVTQAEKNEWWEHAFATAYYVNVLHDWDVDRWEIHNEPNQNGQGWLDNGGSAAEYNEFLAQTTDAINYVYANYLGNRPRNIHAPGLSGNPNRNTWATTVLDGSDSLFDTFDYHWYSNNQDSIARGYIDTLIAHNTDGVIEPLWNSEWGTYNSTYNTVGAALDYADQLFKMNLPANYVQGSNIFSMYYWGTAEGLVRDDGSKQETFYSLKTMLPAIQNAKAQYSVSGTLPSSVKVMSSKDATGFYMVVINRGTGTANQTITANVSAHRTTGTASVTEYSATNKAVVVANPAVSAGSVTFTSPANSIVTVRVP
jgi:hypothetical protein